MEEAAALEFGDDVLHKIGVGTGDMCGSNDEAIAGTAGHVRLQVVCDVARAANHGLVDCATASDREEVARGWIALAAQRDGAIAEAVLTGQASELFVAQRLVDALQGEVEIQCLRKQRQLVDLERGVARRTAILSSASARDAAATGMTRLQTFTSSGSRPAAAISRAPRCSPA